MKPRFLLLVAPVILLTLLSNINLESGNELMGGAPNVIFVDSANIGGTHDGTSWATAFNDLQDAIDASFSLDTIWVAQGTYYPTDSSGVPALNPRNATFLIDKTIVLLGGFEGNEITSQSRNWELNSTILTGDVGNPGDSSDNCFHVVWFDHVTSNMSIDGFTITEGFASGLGSDGNGAGIYNDGSGSGSASNPDIRHCTLSKNYASDDGGGIYNDGDEGMANPNLRSCLFAGNAAGNVGGAIYNNGGFLGEANANYFNCVFIGNYAEDKGGAMYNDGGFGGESKQTITNSSFGGNFAEDKGGAVYNLGDAGNADAIFTNTIVYGNSDGVKDKSASSTFTYCLIQDESPAGIGNLSGFYPLSFTPFIEPPNSNSAPITEGDLRLRFCSPAINMGNNAVLAPEDTLDIDGNPRIYNMVDVDIGAYEFQNDQPTNTIVYVDSSAIGGLNNGTTWSNAFIDLQGAINAIYGCGNTEQIWVAKGTYYTTNGIDREIFFNIPDSLKMYGGFSPSEGVDSLHERNWNLNPTILSADIGVIGDSTDNSFHVIYTENVSEFTVIDGFNIKYGNADGFGHDEEGGGWLNLARSSNISSPVCRNNRFSNNYGFFGGGLASIGVANGEAHANIKDCKFVFNNAVRGGGLYILGENGNAYPSILQCEILNNQAEFLSGGLHIEAINGDVNANLVDCIVSGNYSDRSAGGVTIWSNNGSCNATILRCTLSGNEADIAGGGLAIVAYDIDATPFISETIITGNKAAVGGGLLLESSNSAGVNPKFINTTIAGNLGTVGGGAMTFTMLPLGNADPTFTNSIIYHNSSGIQFLPAGGLNFFTHCLVQGLNLNSGGNLSDIPAINPLFLEPICFNSAPTTLGNYVLARCSPLLDEGANDSLNIQDSLDLFGNPRIFDMQTVDFGAYEYQGETIDTFILVDSNATNSSFSGLTWEDAFQDLQMALNTSRVCNDINEIWVAKGTYFPTNKAIRDTSFRINDGIKLYGGFNPALGIDSIHERNPISNETVLSGDIGIYGFIGDNSRHVIQTTGVSEKTIVDGFIITQGNATGSFPNGVGGGWLNDGSGTDSQSNPSIANCIFKNNSSSLFGGAFYNYGASQGSVNPSFTNCIFSGNSALFSGGAIYNDGGNGGIASPKLLGCTFSGNSSGFSGGAISSYGSEGQSNPSLINTVVYGNSSGVLDFEASSIYQNCLIQGISQDTVGNLDGTDPSNNPIFLQMPDFNNAPTHEGDLRLQACSPLINRGINDSLPPYLMQDLYGNNRIAYDTVDIGAFEFPDPPPSDSIFIVDCQPDNPCLDTLILNDLDLGGIYKASQLIKTTGNVTITDSTQFKALRFELGEGFKVNVGVYFETVNDPCGTPPATPGGG